MTRPRALKSLRQGASARHCAACSREFVFEAGIIEAVRGKLRRLDAPPALLNRISREISRAVEEGGETEPRP